MGWLDKLIRLERRLENNVSEHDAFYEQVIEKHFYPSRITTEPGHEDIVDVLLWLQRIQVISPRLTIKAVLMVTNQILILLHQLYLLIL